MACIAALKQEVEELLKKITKKSKIALESPPDSSIGEFAFPCFQLSKELEKNPNEIAQDIAKTIPLSNLLEKVEVKGPYINFFINKKKLIKETLEEVSAAKVYGSKEQNKKTIFIDYSAPNIAKPFHIGHLRSTIIGNSFKKIFQYLGYKVVGENYLGDWGTQFGKLIVAFKKWGDQEKLESEPTNHLLEIYVKFHEEAKKNPELDDEAREAFKKLEDGDEELHSLWNKFRELSIKEFEITYKKLGIQFESYSGESVYVNQVEESIVKLQKHTETKIDDGALIVDLKSKDMPPFLLRKSDGATTYHARDLSAALYRLDRYKPEKLLYVVAAPQRLHFKQLFEVIDMMGIPSKNFIHVDFGMVKFADGKMSTRAGNIVLLDEVLDKVIELAKKTIETKNPNLKDKNKVAKIVGIGAIIFADLSTDRIRDVVFDWNKMLDFEGETAPYLQYTYARISSIIRKAGVELKDADFKKLKEKEEFLVVKKISEFSSTIQNAADNLKPHIIARYLLDLAQLFNNYYQKIKIIQEDKDLMKARLLLIDSVRKVIAQGLDLLGIQVIEEM